jgi:hypothetical protein
LLARLGIVPIPHFLKFLLVDDSVFHWLELNGADGDDFEISATLGAGNDFAFIDFFFVDIEIGFAFWTINHNRPPGLDRVVRVLLLIFSFSGAVVK